MFTSRREAMGSERVPSSSHARALTVGDSISDIKVCTMYERTLFQISRLISLNDASTRYAASLTKRAGDDVHAKTLEGEQVFIRVE